MLSNWRYSRIKAVLTTSSSWALPHLTTSFIWLNKALSRPNPRWNWKVVSHCCQLVAETQQGFFIANYAPLFVNLLIMYKDFIADGNVRPIFIKKLGYICITDVMHILKNLIKIYQFNFVSIQKQCWIFIWSKYNFCRYKSIIKNLQIF